MLLIPLYLFLIRAKGSTEDVPVFVVISENEQGAWELVYQDYGDDDNSKKYLAEYYIISEKIRMPEYERSRMLYGTENDIVPEI